MATKSGQRQAANLRLLYEPVQRELEEVEQRLRRELRSANRHVDQLVRYAFRLSGKRLRPALVLLSGKAIGTLGRDHVLLATVMEMIHTATLVHDDVLDEADLRRHQATVNARWSNEASVLLGDLLFSHSFYLASTLESTYACRKIGEATGIICGGELRQIDSRDNYRLREAEYLEIVDAKTAELTSCCCRLGAKYAGADEGVEERLASFGRNLGVAFQIIDDLLDLVGSEQVVGKSLGTDLEKHKPTLPVIRLLDVASDADRREILAVLHSGGDYRELLLPWLGRYEALEYARQKACSFALQAENDLRDLPGNAAADVLRQLPAFVVARKH